MYLCILYCIYVCIHVSWIGHVERMEDSRMPKSDERENLH